MTVTLDAGSRSTPARAGAIGVIRAKHRRRRRADPQRQPDLRRRCPAGYGLVLRRLRGRRRHGECGGLGFGPGRERDRGLRAKCGLRLGRVDQCERLERYGGGGIGSGVQIDGLTSSNKVTVSSGGSILLAERRLKHRSDRASQGSVTVDNSGSITGSLVGNSPSSTATRQRLRPRPGPSNPGLPCPGGCEELHAEHQPGGIYNAGADVQGDVVNLRHRQSGPAGRAAQHPCYRGFHPGR